LVSFDDEPAIVPEDVITGIRKNVQRINQAQAASKEQGLKHGDPVTILDGPFERYQAIFDTALEGSDRVRLLIKFIRDKQIRVQVPADMAKPQKS
jgi:transcription antitermination factor NusG